MWYPVGADIQTRFTVDATIDGLAPDLVVVAQGAVTRTAGGVHIERDFLDIDLPLVAMRGLERAEAHGVGFYSRELERKRGVLGKGRSVRVCLGCRRTIKENKQRRQD